MECHVLGIILHTVDSFSVVHKHAVRLFLAITGFFQSCCHYRNCLGSMTFAYLDKYHVRLFLTESCQAGYLICDQLFASEFLKNVVCSHCFPPFVLFFSYGYNMRHFEKFGQNKKTFNFECLLWLCDTYLITANSFLKYSLILP